MAVLPADSARAGRFSRQASRRRISGVTSSLDVYIPGAVLLFILLACFVWPLIGSVPRPVGGSILDSNLPIGSAGHILGTDPTGNDILSRLMYGGRVSLEVAGATQLIGLGIGGVIGIVTTFVGGFFESIVNRCLDVLIAFPTFILALAIIDGLGAGEMNVIWALSIFFVPAFARLTRAATLQLRERPFVVASSLIGTRRWRTILFHIVPNVAPGMLTYALLNAGLAIMVEATLSYVGYGVPAPGPSWGNMIATGETVMSTQPSLILVPSIALFITVIALNMLGDGLRSRWGVQ